MLFAAVTTAMSVLCCSNAYWKSPSLLLNLNAFVHKGRFKNAKCSTSCLLLVFFLPQTSVNSVSAEGEVKLWCRFLLLFALLLLLANSASNAIAMSSSLAGSEWARDVVGLGCCGRGRWLLSLTPQLSCCRSTELE